MTKRSLQSIAFGLLAFFAHPAFSQDVASTANPDLKYPKAKVTESTIASVDAARRVRHFDASPDGRTWLLVDAFGQMESIVLNGKRFEAEYNDIPSGTAKVSPNGDYAIWIGLTRAFTNDGFNQTLSTLYRNTDSVTAYTSDYNQIAFSPDGSQWAAMFPYANAKQQQDRNAVVINGKEVAKNGGVPKQFTFNRDGSWAFRTTDGLRENLVTRFGEQFLRERKGGGVGSIQPMDSLVWHYTPAKRVSDAILDAVDFNADGSVAQLHRTSYRVQDQKNALSYVVQNGKMHFPTRWVKNVLLDTAGNTLAYFACDPKLNNVYNEKDRDERIGIVVKNGEKYDGPFPAVERLFLSPSGKNIAYSVGGDSARIILNKKALGPVGQLAQALWSPDEKGFAYVALNKRGLAQVVVNGKISDPYEHIGKLGWTKDSKFVEYVAVRHGKVVKVRQSK